MLDLKKEFKRYLKYLDQSCPQIRDSLRPGLQDANASMKAEYPQFSLPTELVELYGLADGQREDTTVEFSPGFRFMSFREALSMFSTLREEGIGDWIEFPIFYGETSEISAYLELSSDENSLSTKKRTSLWENNFEDQINGLIFESVASYFMTLNVAIEQNIIYPLSQCEYSCFEVDDEAFCALIKNINDSVRRQR